MSNDLKAKVTADITDFNKKMNEMGKSAKAGVKVAKAAIAGLALAVAAFGAASLKAAVDLDKLKTRMMALLGEERGAAFFERVSKAAAESAADTDDLIKSILELTGWLGREPDIGLAEGIYFMAQRSGKDIKDVSTAIGKMYQKLKEGGKVGVEFKEQMGSALGLDAEGFFQDLYSGALTAEDALTRLSDIGMKAKDVYENSLAGAIARVSGVWTKFLQKAGEKSIEPLQNAINQIAAALDEIAESGMLGKIADGFAQIVSNIDAESIMDLFEAALGFLDKMMPLMNTLAKHWDVILGVVLLYKAAMIAASIAAITAAAVANPIAAAAGAAVAAGAVATMFAVMPKATDERSGPMEVTVTPTGVFED